VVRRRVITHHPLRVRRRHPLSEEYLPVIDTVLGIAVTGVRAGRAVAGVCIVPVRAAYRSSIGAPFRAAVDDMAVDGAAARRALQTQGEAALDRLLAGPLTERVARLLGEHHVVERLAQELTEQGTVTAVIEQALENGLAADITEQVIASPEMEKLIAFIAASPELRDAIAEQSAGLAQEMVAGVRTRTQSMDDIAERTVRGWLRRTRPRPA
jgi:hypothetical protein